MNPLQKYKIFVLDNLTNEITYSNNRFRHNDHSFFQYKTVVWYKNYIDKTANSTTTVVTTAFTSAFSGDFS